ncbi:MAG: choice-of-anchor Q domain-containing protein [Kiritimatiellia bacterium]|jgi:hypothetical protein
MFARVCITRSMLALLACMIMSKAPAATTWYVATNGNDTAHDGTNGWEDAYLTINKAVAESASGDTVLVGAGEYLLTAVISNASKNIHLLGVAGREATIINGNYPARNLRPLWMGAGRVGGFTITNGVHNTLGNYGGGVYLANALMTNCIISGNMPRRYGGGVYVGIGAVMSNCVISGNRVEWLWGGSAGCLGGGVFIENGEVWDCLIADNSSENTCGGCYFSTLGGGLLMNSVVSNNIAATNAGGVYLSLDSHVVSNSVICHNRVTGSYAFSGGGGTLYRGGRIANSLIYGNHDNAGGGGLYVNRNAVIESCTIAGNDGYFGGLYLFAGVDGYTVPVMNSIVYSNTAVSGDGNLYGANSRTPFTNCCVIPSVSAYGEGNTTNYPMFVDPVADNYRLQYGSPCINAGMNQSWMADALDLDGIPRILPAGGVVDIGCYEFYLRPITMIIIH